MPKQLISKIVFIVSLGLLVTHCSSTPLVVETDPPGADVSVGYPGQAPRKVGESPYTLKPSDMSDRGMPMHILVVKEGFLPNSVMVPATLTSRAGKVNFKLEQQVLPSQCQKQTEALNNVGRSVAEAQSLIKSKNLDGAEKIMTNLNVQYPGLSVTYDLLGNIYYLRRDFEKALTAYRKSLTLAPENANTQTIIKQIEGILGGRGTGGVN